MERIRGLKWEMEVTNPFRGAVYLKCKGYMDVTSASPSRVPMQKVMDSGPQLQLFIHALEVTGFDTQLRTVQAQWFSSRKDRIKAMHILLHSPLIALAANFLAVIMGQSMKIHYKESTFMDAMKRAAAAEGVTLR